MRVFSQINNWQQKQNKNKKRKKHTKKNKKTDKTKRGAPLLGLAKSICYNFLRVFNFILTVLFTSDVALNHSLSQHWHFPHGFTKKTPFFL